MLVAEKFIRSLVTKYGKHTINTDGGSWCDKVWNMIILKHHLHSPIQKSLMERVNNFFKEIIESFDD